MWSRWGYLVRVEEMGLFDPCGGDGFIWSMWKRRGYLVHVEEMGLFDPCGGDGVI